MKIDKVLTSSFGEYRPSHFHAGVDFSTGGKTGYRVYAVADGEIYRLRHTKRGYGRALYIRHANGFVSLYAHLSSFNNALGLEDFVRRRAPRFGQYAGDIYLSKPVPVKKGDKIGLSGETGAGLPHLHFEIRDADNNPVNPCSAGLLIKDVSPPVIEAIVFEPLDHLSAVNGGRDHLTMPVRGGVPDTVIVRGKIRCRLQAYDGGTRGNRLGLYELEVLLDGETFIRERFERFTFEESPLVGIVIDPIRSHLTPTVYTYNLFTRGGTSVGIIDHAAPESIGCLDSDSLAPGPHRMEIIAGDAAGNKTRTVLSLVVNHPPVITFKKSSPQIFHGGVELEMNISSGDPGKGIRGVESQYTTDRGITWLDAGLRARRQVNQSSAGAETWILSREKAFEKGPLVQVRVKANDGFETSSWARSSFIISRPAGRGPGGWGDSTAYNAEPVGPVPTGSGEKPPGLTVIPRGSYAQFLVRDSGPGWKNPSISLREPQGSTRALPTRWLDNDLYEAVLPFDGLARGSWTASVSEPGGRDAGTAVFDVLPVSPERGWRASWDDLELVFPAGSLHEKSFVSREPSSVEVRTSLLQASRAYHLESTSYPFTGPVTVRIKPREGYGDLRRLGIYSYDPFTKGWRLAGSGKDTGSGWVYATVRHFSDYVVLEDVIPPSISSVLPSDGSKIKGARAVTFRLTDAGMGVDEGSVKVSLDGRRLDYEYDPDRRRVTAPIGFQLIRGDHSLIIEASDRAGNEASVFLGEFTVR